MNTTRLLVIAALIAACTADDDEAPTKVATVSELRTPESVKWDASQDVYFVSNINGSPGDKDGNGFITRIDVDENMRDTVFISGLNAPKGMAIVGDTLWVTDIDEVRGFNTKTAAPVATVAVPGAVFLNDIAAAPDGSLYITDTAIRFGASGAEHVGTDQILRIAPNRTVSVALSGDTLGRPNGIAWDEDNDQFVIVSFGGNAVFGWKPGAAAPTVIATGKGQFDGVEIADDEIWVSSWADSSVYSYEAGQWTRAISGVPSPADFGYDAKRKRLLIPVFTGNRVEIWEVK